MKLAHSFFILLHLQSNWLILFSYSLHLLYYLQPTILMEYTGFSESELTTCMERMAEKVAEEPITASRRQLNAVKKKYENNKYLEVSTNVELPNVKYVMDAKK